MSTHSVKAKRRHPDTEREHYEVAHMTFELSKKDHTFALIAGEALTARDRKPLFSGVITDHMADDLEVVAWRIRQLKLLQEGKDDE
ncbi:MAG: hypothetical protein CMJ25_24210 [Phycisphaerae bacterium]|mgnify:FL=1|nr:hypothetical protein [Phycisphaerae bacterium]